MMQCSARGLKVVSLIHCFFGLLWQNVYEYILTVAFGVIGDIILMGH